MTSVIAALSFGGEWHIHDKDAAQLRFQIFYKLLTCSKMRKKKIN